MLAAFVCLNNGSDWLPPGEAVVRMDLEAMCSAVSGDNFSPTEDQVFSPISIVI
jgi:hypothetical protein